MIHYGIRLSDSVFAEWSRKHVVELEHTRVFCKIPMLQDKEFINSILSAQWPDADDSTIFELLYTANMFNQCGFSHTLFIPKEMGEVSVSHTDAFGQLPDRHRIPRHYIQVRASRLVLAPPLEGCDPYPGFDDRVVDLEDLGESQSTEISL